MLNFLWGGIMWIRNMFFGKCQVLAELFLFYSFMVNFFEEVICLLHGVMAWLNLFCFSFMLNFFLRRYNVRRLITWAWWECAKGRGDQWSPKTRRQTPPSPYLHKNTKNTEKGKIQKSECKKRLRWKPEECCNLKLMEWRDARIHRGLYAYIL